MIICCLVHASNPTSAPSPCLTGEQKRARDTCVGAEEGGFLRHSCWTYWGHSGAPLFCEDGARLMLTIAHSYRGRGRAWWRHHLAKIVAICIANS